MRPVDKGEKPDKEYRCYADAKPDLVDRIGAYCSYCEFPIEHVPEVEHKESKSTGGALIAWENLLLSCKYCNCRKLVKVSKGEKEQYIWPDEDDTFHAYSYVNGMPELNKDYLDKQEKTIQQRAYKLFHLVQLNHIPTSPKDKDRRFFRRNEVFNVAEDELNTWNKISVTNHKEEYKKTLIRLALATGFFSVWLEVFKDVPEIKRAFIDAFAGTNKKYFYDT